MTLTICTSGINAGSSMPGNPELQAVTNPPDNSTQQKSNDFFSSAIFHALYSTAVGVCTTFVKNRVVSPLNDPGKVFLREHCFNNMSRDESDEYGKLTPFTPLYLTEIAVTSTAFLLPAVACARCIKDVNQSMTGYAILRHMNGYVIFRHMMPSQCDLNLKKSRIFHL